MKKTKILMVFGEPFVFGGQETFAYNVYKNNNNLNISFDFYTPYKIYNKSLKSILKNGDTFFSGDTSFNRFVRKINFLINFKRFIRKKSGDYDLIHFNSGSSFILSQGAKIAKKNGVKKVAVHSHASGISSFKHSLFNKLFEKNYKFSDIFLACSVDAAKFRFPKYVIEQNRYNIITNGIDLEKYKFNNDVRIYYREQLKIKKDEILLGNVGRLSEEKNQIFLLEILQQLNLTNDKYRLLLIGDGPEKERIITKIQELNLENNVIMLEKRNDINNLLMAMDLFLFPSFFEGLGIALVEAEAIGLPAVVSSGIPEEAIINDNCIKMNDFSKNDWIDTITNLDFTKKNSSSKIEHYSISNTVEQLVGIYESDVYLD